MLDADVPCHRDFYIMDEDSMLDTIEAVVAVDSGGGEFSMVDVQRRVASIGEAGVSLERDRRPVPGKWQRVVWINACGLRERIGLLVQGESDAIVGIIAHLSAFPSFDAFCELLDKLLPQDLILRLALSKIDFCLDLNMALQDLMPFFVAHRKRVEERHDQRSEMALKMSSRRYQLEGFRIGHKPRKLRAYDRSGKLKCISPVTRFEAQCSGVEVKSLMGGAYPKLASLPNLIQKIVIGQAAVHPFRDYFLVDMRLDELSGVMAWNQGALVRDFSNHRMYMSLHAALRTLKLNSNFSRDVAPRIKVRPMCIDMQFELNRSLRGFFALDLPDAELSKTTSDEYRSLVSNAQFESEPLQNWGFPSMNFGDEIFDNKIVSDGGYAQTIANNGSNEILCASEVASLLKVSVGSVRNMTSDGLLPCLRLGRRVRYSRDEIMRLLLDSRAERK